MENTVLTQEQTEILTAIAASNIQQLTPNHFSLLNPQIPYNEDHQSALQKMYDNWREKLMAHWQDKPSTQERLATLRTLMKKENIHALIIPQSDPYQNEYLPLHAMRLAWMTNFTGSFGIAIVLEDTAAIFVDGRYIIQVRKEVDPNSFSCYHHITTPPDQWLKEQLKEKMNVGFDPWLHTPNNLKTFKKACEEKKALLTPTSHNLIDKIRTAPPPPLGPVFCHPIPYSGKTVEEKIAILLPKLKENNIQTAFFNSPESIAWLLNIRGSDIPYIPLPLSFAFLDHHGQVTLLIDQRKITRECQENLPDCIKILPESALSDIFHELGKNKKTVALDPSKVPCYIFSALENYGASIIPMSDPTTFPKAIKNKTEINGAKVAHIKDGIAMVRFLCWLEHHNNKDIITEIDAARKAEFFRSQQKNFQGLSFETISAVGENGAICHYRVTSENNKSFQKQTLYLIDSGGQYSEGTTDITRTIALSSPSESLKTNFTLVLKAHIALARAKFPKGTCGTALDGITRYPLWQHGYDYDHGTGHGIGSFLGVHEGPQRIAKQSAIAPLEPGMLLSNEPGIYKENDYGIRTENIMLVVEDSSYDETNPLKKQMLTFETLTLVPIDYRLISTHMLSKEEVNWIDAYHKRIYEILLPELKEPQEKEWLFNVTRPLQLL